MISRRNRLSRWIAGCGMLLLTGPAFSQQVEFTIQPEVMRVGQVATAELKIRGANQAGRPELPSQQGLQITYRAQGQQTQIINGRVDSFISYTYSVVPIQPGDYTIGPFTYQMGKSQFGIPAVKLKVLPPGGSGQGTAEQEVDWNSLIFATMETKTPEVYNQQFLDIELSIFFKDSLRLDNQVQPLNLPTAGLTIKEMRSLSERREEVNGEIYEVRRFLIKFQAITEGEFVLEPTLRAHILVNRPQRRSGSLFDEMFGTMSRYDKHPIDLKPEALTLTINPLPTKGRPADYQGAVGEFALDIKATPHAIQAGDPVTIRTTISGQGNIDTLTAPNLNLGPDFRVYESKLISKELNESGSSGRKVFEQVIIPRESGDITLPPLTFSFFNPRLKTFVELKKDGLTIQVTESDQAASAVVMGQNGGTPTRDLQVVDLDIAYLKPLPRTWVSLGTEPRLPRWVHGLPPAILALTFVLTRQRRRREGNVQLQRRQAAPKKARAGIQRAQQALAANDTPAYYEAVHQALFDFYSNRLGWAPGEFDPGRLTQHLKEGNAPDDDIDFVRRLLMHAESVRYGAGLPDSARDDSGRDQLDRLAAILKRSERS